MNVSELVLLCHSVYNLGGACLFVLGKLMLVPCNTITLVWEDDMQCFAVP